MFENLKEQLEVLEDLFCHRYAEMWITFLLLLASIKLPILLRVVLFMVIQMIISMIITYHKSWTYYYHRKTGQKIQAGKFWLLIFVSWSYPQMWDGHQVGKIYDEYLIWNLRSKPPKQGILVDDLPKDITDHDTIYDKIYDTMDRREEKGEEILDRLYVREIETAIFFMLLSFIIVFPPILFILIPYLVWLLMSIFFPPMKERTLSSTRIVFQSLTTSLTT